LKAEQGADPESGGGDVFARFLESATLGIARASGPSGAVSLEAVTLALQDGVRGAVETQSDLVLACKAMVLAALRGTAEQGEAALRTLGSVSTTILRKTSDLGGDRVAATKGIILGAIAGAKGIGVEVPGAAATAAKGALDGAGEAGSVDSERILAVLKEPIGGLRVALPPRGVR
jgi:hypothetical protein